MISPPLFSRVAIAVLSVACSWSAFAQDVALAPQSAKIAEVVPTSLPLSIEKGAHIAILGGDAHGADADAWVV